MASIGTITSSALEVTPVVTSNVDVLRARIAQLESQLSQEAVVNIPTLTFEPEVETPTLAVVDVTEGIVPAIETVDASVIDVAAVLAEDEVKPKSTRSRKTAE